jgi:3-oxoadipate enol-lactonase
MIWIDANGINLRACQRGDGRRQVVLIHELGGSLESFDDLAPYLARDYRLLAYDQRGAGLSEKTRQPFTLADHAADLDAVLNALGINTPCDLVGVAAGAAIAVDFALTNPGRVASLCLCNPALTVPPARRAYLNDRSDLAASAGMRAIADSTLDKSYPAHLRGDGRAFAAYRARFLANDPVTYGHANRALAEADIETGLGAIAVPSLVLAGEHDLLRPPEQVRAVAARIPGASFAMIPSGHLMPVQGPQEMARVIAAFLATVPVAMSEAAE